jgi:hypothetical protein
MFPVNGLADYCAGAFVTRGNGRELLSGCLIGITGLKRCCAQLRPTYPNQLGLPSDDSYVKIGTPTNACVLPATQPVRPLHIELCPLSMLYRRLSQNKFSP